MRLISLLLVVSFLCWGCDASEEIVAPPSKPSSKLSTLSFRSAQWNIHNLLIKESSSGYSQFVGSDPQHYSKQDSVVISRRDSIGISSVTDSNFVFKGKRGPVDEAVVVIDRDNMKLSFLYSYSWSNLQTGGGPSSNNSHGIKFKDVPFEFSHDSSIRVELTGSQILTQFTYSSSSNYDSGYERQAYHSSSSSNASGPLDMTDSTAVTLVLAR